ncbi:MAG TPA: CHAT domain-containing protein, partial [Thermoanaerobaculia bacterium]|nr:CHAT domain-containing protein [Thermoanaerobaculia bacterium]
ALPAAPTSLHAAPHSLPSAPWAPPPACPRAYGPSPARVTHACRKDTSFAFSYQEFLRGRPAGSRGRGAEGAAAAHAQLVELVRLGEAVGAAVFVEPFGARLAALLAEARGRGEEVLLAFETAEPALLSIPFEAARLPGGVVPALEPGVRVVRRDASATVRPLTPLAGPLRILVAVGAPDEARTRNVVLDSERELQTILDAVEEARRLGNAEVRILEVGHPGEIQRALEEQSFHALHLSGHGNAGVIEMETEEGEPVAVRPRDLVDSIRAAGRPLPLIFLGSFLSGAGDSETASFAQGLLAAGMPQVLAMQTSVSDWFATRLAGAFCRHLARLEEPLASHALALARQEVESERRRALAAGREEPGLTPEYATPSLFLAADERPLLDRGAPQEPMRVQPRPFAQGPVPLLRMDDLIGRRQELRQLLRVLRDDPRAVARHGRKAGGVVLSIGGVGKSALAGRAMSHEPDRADYQKDLSVSYYKMGDLHSALGQGETPLEFYRKALEITARLAKAEPARADWSLGPWLEWPVVHNPRSTLDAFVARGAGRKRAVWERARQRSSSAGLPVEPRRPCTLKVPSSVAKPSTRIIPRRDCRRPEGSSPVSIRGRNTARGTFSLSSSRGQSHSSSRISASRRSGSPGTLAESWRSTDSFASAVCSRLSRSNSFQLASTARDVAARRCATCVVAVLGRLQPPARSIPKIKQTTLAFIIRGCSRPGGLSLYRPRPLAPSRQSARRRGSPPMGNSASQ